MWLDGVYYAGGGGGAAGASGNNGGAGGVGGGGKGDWDNDYIQPGSPNTGGGGGGSRSFSVVGTIGRPGGSGIVIIRYLNSYPDAVATTGNPTLSNTGGYKFYMFTQSGSIRF